MPAKKRTGIFTNSPALALALKSLQCDGAHAHGGLTDGRARKCQEYPEEFCEAVCKTVIGERNRGSEVRNGAMLLGSLSSRRHLVNPATRS